MHASQKKKKQWDKMIWNFSFETQRFREFLCFLIFAGA
jgi:hypothetical protein